MQVILQKDVKNLGQAGQIVSVKNGYARHFLFPRKMAILYTKAGAKEQAHREQWITAKQKKALLLRQNLLEKLQSIEISFTKEADASGHLFGSVTVTNIAKELENKSYEVQKKWILLERPLKQVGEYIVRIQPDKQTGSTEIKVHIKGTAPKKTNKTELEGTKQKILKKSNIGTNKEKKESKQNTKMEEELPAKAH